MKQILILSINIYQKYISLFLHQALGVENACRFYPTCSDYTKKSIAQKGVFKGGAMSLIRILKCNPYYKGQTYYA